MCHETKCKSPTSYTLKSLTFPKCLEIKWSYWEKDFNCCVYTSKRQSNRPLIIMYHDLSRSLDLSDSGQWQATNATDWLDWFPDCGPTFF